MYSIILGLLSNQIDSPLCNKLYGRYAAFLLGQQVLLSTQARNACCLSFFVSIDQDYHALVSVNQLLSLPHRSPYPKSLILTPGTSLQGMSGPGMSRDIRSVKP